MSTDSKRRSNKDVIKRFSEEVVNGGNFDVLEELVADDVEFDNEIAKMPAGRDGVKTLFTDLRSGFSNVACSINSLVEEDDMVAESFTFTGEHTGTFHGIKATGRKVSMSGMAMFRIRDGIIVSRVGLEDQAGLMRQLGVGPERQSH